LNCINLGRIFLRAQRRRAYFWKLTIHPTSDTPSVLFAMYKETHDDS
jgi:hypothetical protein